MLSLVALLVLPASAATPPALIAKSVTIYRDNYGVPHVYGPTDASCVFGYIYAQAEDNFWQIEDSYIRSLGRASEVYGEKTIDDDRLVRALEIPKLAQAEYDRASPETKKLGGRHRRRPELLPGAQSEHQAAPHHAFRTLVRLRVQSLRALLQIHLRQERAETRRDFERLGIAGFQHVGHHSGEERRRTRHAVHQSAPAVFRRRAMVRRPRPQRIGMEHERRIVLRFGISHHRPQRCSRMEPHRERSGYRGRLPGDFRQSRATRWPIDTTARTSMPPSGKRPSRSRPPMDSWTALSPSAERITGPSWPSATVSRWP